MNKPSRCGGAGCGGGGTVGTHIPTIDQTTLRSILDYNKETGVFVWKVRLSNRAKVGMEAAPNQASRYKLVGIYRKRYLMHHLAWLYVYGELPTSQLDHINQDTHNNSIGNLRLVSAGDNAKNKPKRRDNTSGVTGVSWDVLSEKWVVRIKVECGKYKNMGRYDDINEATRVRNKALRDFGYHPNHGEQHTRSQYRSK